MSRLERGNKRRVRTGFTARIALSRQNKVRLLNGVEIHPVSISPFALGAFDIFCTRYSQIANYKFFAARACDANR